MHQAAFSVHSLVSGEFGRSQVTGDGTPLQYSCLANPMDGGAWWAAVHGVKKSRTRLKDFFFTFHFHALEKEMATHASVLAWRIPGTGEPGGLQSRTRLKRLSSRNRLQQNRKPNREMTAGSHSLSLFLSRSLHLCLSHTHMCIEQKFHKCVLLTIHDCKM